MKLLLFGATGLVGGNVLDLALGDGRIDAVVAPVRRPLSTHPKLLAPIVDFDHLATDADWWAADAVICALGTTMHAAGSKGAFRSVDYGYQLAVANAAKKHETQTFVLNSAKGANPASRFFYMRVKGEVERDIATLAFRSLTIAQPGLIGGNRDHPRFAEQVGSRLLGTLHPILPREWRINPARKIAKVMLDAAVAARSGTHVVPPTELN